MMKTKKKKKVVYSEDAWRLWRTLVKEKKDLEQSKKYALVFTDHTLPPGGRDTQSLFQVAENKNIPILFSSREENWDDYDLLIWWHNKPPQIKTTADVAWWMGDARAPEKLTGSVASHADYMFLCMDYLIPRYEELFRGKGFYLPQCGDDMPDPVVRSLSSKCVFLGNLPKRHVPHLAPITANPTDADFRKALTSVHANRIPILDHLRKSGVPVQVVSGEKYTYDQKGIYRNAQFCLAISPQIPGYASCRLYNILAGAGFALSLKYPGMENQFENHKHLVWFESAEEAVDLIRYYETRPNEMQEIRENGHKEYLRNHTAERRIEQIVEMVDQHRSQR
jgi:hypothetical protein